MGVVLIGGLITSLALTLVLIPVVYATLADGRRDVKRVNNAHETPAPAEWTADIGGLVTTI